MITFALSLLTDTYAQIEPVQFDKQILLQPNRKYIFRS